MHEHLSAAFVEELIAQPNARAFIKLLQSSTYRLGIEDMEKDYVYIEHYTDSFLYALAKKNIYYSLDAPWYIPAICILQSVSWKISSILLKVCVIMYPLRIWSAC